jgi:hypothetical protein
VQKAIFLLVVPANFQLYMDLVPLLQGNWERAITLFLFDTKQNFVFMLTKQHQIINGDSLHVTIVP